MTIIDLMRECLEIKKVARVDNVFQAALDSWWFMATTSQAAVVRSVDHLQFEMISNSIWKTL